MRLKQLIDLIGGHADEITNELMADVSTNPRTLFLHSVPPDRLRERVRETYEHIDAWLAERDEQRIETVYGAAGAWQQEQGVPLSELVYAFGLVKQHLLAFIRRNDLADSAPELITLTDLLFSLGAFFDKAIYYGVRGYERSATERAIRAVAKGRVASDRSQSDAPAR